MGNGNGAFLRNGGYKNLIIWALSSILTASLGVNIFYLKSDRTNVLSQVAQVNENIQCLKDKVEAVRSMLVTERRTMTEIARLLRYPQETRLKEGADELYQHLKRHDLELDGKSTKEERR